jgi:hypothetical protein
VHSWLAWLTWTDIHADNNVPMHEELAASQMTKRGGSVGLHLRALSRLCCYEPKLPLLTWSMWHAIFSLRANSACLFGKEPLLATRAPLHTAGSAYFHQQLAFSLYPAKARSLSHTIAVAWLNISVIKYLFSHGSSYLFMFHLQALSSPYVGGSNGGAGGGGFNQQQHEASVSSTL